MKAARVNRLGSPNVIVIEDIAVPSPGEEDLLVRVCAAGVGPWDALVRTGKSGLPLALPVTLGSEISGIVEKVGAKTRGFAVGDEVFGATNPLFIGGYAEYAVVVAHMVATVSAEPSMKAMEEASTQAASSIRFLRVPATSRPSARGQGSASMRPRPHGSANGCDMMVSLLVHEY